jgi:hypothetical protein
LAFSCRKRASRSLQNANDLAREAVGCNAGLGGKVSQDYALPSPAMSLSRQPMTFPHSASELANPAIQNLILIIHTIMR